MSWLLDLYRTYESNLDQVGVLERRHNDQEFTLLPISHTTQNAHIEVQVTEDGQYHSAAVIPKSDASTLIPCTEDSASRAGAVIAPYPLHDKLSYCAGDFVAYGGEIKKANPFDTYIENLRKWAESPYSIPKVKSLYRYLRKGTLIEDLVRDKVLYADDKDNNRLIDKWDKALEEKHGVKPEVFSVMVGGPEALFVRFNVRRAGGFSRKVWDDPEMFESFIRYYSGELGDSDLCYVTGEKRPATEKHANKIRNAADKAKLISSNDKTGFTYRGRFSNASEAARISYDVSQKAHNALKWLINRQGRIVGQRVFLVWGNESLEVPHPSDDTWSLEDENGEERIIKSDTLKGLAHEVSLALNGYRNRVAERIDAQVFIMLLDSATTGRMAVLYYRNLNEEHYLNRLAKWHSTCVWLHRYQRNSAGEFVSFFGAPATKDIAFAAYGPRADDKVVKGLMERMLPCVVDEQPRIPQDIVRSAVQRASNPVAMETWEWEKTLSIACALVNHKEGKDVALDKENTSRDYLFGRLLAVADVLERRALGRDEKRSSNAIRYMNAFAKHPARTWKTIQSSLQPYQARLGRDGIYLSSIIDEIGSRIDPNEFNDKPLSGLYLLGFYSQRHDLFQKKEDKTAEEPESTNEEERSE